MNRDVYSNKDLSEIKERLNKEILRRGTYRWWNPLTTPAVGRDQRSPISLPEIGDRVPVDELTYTINTPSTGSIEPTKNIQYPIHGPLPSGKDWEFENTTPDTTAGHMTAAEMRNFLVGLSMINDIDIYYGRDEIPGLLYRDPEPIEDLLSKAESDKLHRRAQTLVKPDNSDDLDVFTGPEDEERMKDGWLDPNAWIRFEMPNVQDLGTEQVDYVEDSTFNFVNHELELTIEDPETKVDRDASRVEFEIDEDGYLVESVLIGHKLVEFPKDENGDAIMYSGEKDGEQLDSWGGLDPDNYFAFSATVEEQRRHHDGWVDPTAVVRVLMEGEDLLEETEEEWAEPELKILNEKLSLELTITDEGTQADKDMEQSSYYINREGYLVAQATTNYSNTWSTLGPSNFFDDYGAPIGDGDYHPFNPHIIPLIQRDWVFQDDHRNTKRVIYRYGNHNSNMYGRNPRNPVEGEPLKDRPAFEGVPGTCHIACTGLCSLTCDDECSESCTSTCWARCSNACTATCGNVCTGCSSMCYNSCRTKCENSTGYACVRAGLMASEVTVEKKNNGTAPKVTFESTTYTCEGCSYSCEYYPNKKTTCWDAGCMSTCYSSCENGCAESCVGACTDNDPEDSDSYKGGKGKGCSANCTVNCVGSCQGTCQGYCSQTCWHRCKEQCTDNCTWTCETTCGTGCSEQCKNWCTGCSHTCEGGCMVKADSHTCSGCSYTGGCSSECQHDCKSNCIGAGCRSVCGTDNAGACNANCRINCTNSSCTALCSDQCVDRCTTCVNTCGWQCGACTSSCSADCTSGCSTDCTADCSLSCTTNCVHSCTDDCGGCSSLCYSCVGMCIGVCSVRCNGQCSNCANMCTGWCDQSCGQTCFASCDDFCMNTCVDSCISFATGTVQIVETEEERARREAGWIDPVAEVRIKRVGYDLVEESVDELDIPNLTIKDRDLYHAPKDPATDGDGDVSRYQFYINEDGELIMIIEGIYTRADEMQKYIGIREEENHGYPSMPIQSDS